MNRISHKNLKKKINELIDTSSSIIDLTKLLSGEMSDDYCPTNIFDRYIYYKNRTMTIKECVKYIFTINNNSPKKLLSLLGLTELDIYNVEMLKPSSFNIFGCSLSTDIDIAVVVDKIVQDNFIVLTDIYNKLKDLGYDITKKIDIVQVVVNRCGDIVMTNKGTKETQNMIYYTYQNHKQYYEPIFTKPIKYIDIYVKISGLTKYIIDNINEFNNSDIISEPKSELYTNIIHRIKFINDYLSKYIITKCNSINKSLFVKLLQIIVIYYYPQYIEHIYSKLSLARIISDIYKYDYNTLCAILTRNTIISEFIVDYMLLNDIYQNIIKIYTNISCEVIELFHNFDNKLEYNYKNVIFNDMILMNEFYKSPLVPTDTFISQMKLINPDKQLNIFAIVDYCSTIKKIFDFSDELQLFIDTYCDMCQPRTIEWVEKLNYYQCGNSTNSLICTSDIYSDWVNTYYGLVRGSFIETIIIQTADFNKALDMVVQPFVCGFLTETKEKNSKAISPDLLLIDSITQKIIPVEIKAIVGNCDYNRFLLKEIKLARLQLSNCKDLLRDKYYGFGLIIIMFINEIVKDDSSVEYTYELRYNKFY
jgi:hypothetical protein